MLKFTTDHEWIRQDGDTVTVGITHHAQDALGDVVFVELPEVGSTLPAKATAGVVESVKAAADVYMPVSGEITEVNEALRADPALANNNPMDEGWFLKGSPEPTEPSPGLDERRQYQAFANDNRSSHPTLLHGHPCSSPPLNPCTNSNPTTNFQPPHWAEQRR